MITNFKDMGDHYLLNGAKMDFKCTFADVVVVWQNNEGRTHDYLLNADGRFYYPETHNKWSLRALLYWRIILTT
jgi:glutaryl-CoA dehydrogenase